MQLIWLTQRYTPDKGGMAVSSARLVQGLRDQGHSVKVIHLTHSSAQMAKSSLGNRHHSQRVITVNVDLAGGAEAVFWQLHKELESSLLIGFGGTLPGYLACLWAQWLGTRSMVLLRGNDFEKRIHDLKQGWISHYILDHADIVGCVSNEMTQRVKTMRSLPTVFTPNSIDLDHWSFLDKDHEQSQAWRQSCHLNGKPVVGMVGQLKSKKGLDVAQALFSTYGFGERACLLTVGDVPELEQEQLRALGEQVYHHVPFLDADHLPGYYAAMDAVLLPSYYDGMPNVLLESMALGRLVVASKAGAMPDVIEHGVNGFLFEIGDYVDAGRALDQALSMDSAERDTMSNQARQTMRDGFTPAHEIDVIVSMLNRLKD